MHSIRDSMNWTGDIVIFLDEKTRTLFIKNLYFSCCDTDRLTAK